MFDNDDPGRKGTEKAIEKYSSYANLMPRSVPVGYKDLDEFILDNKNLSYKDLIAL
jgi:DNA primase